MRAWRRKQHSQLPNSLPPPHFIFSFHFFCRGKYTSFLFCTNKGLSPHHRVAMLGKRDWSLVFVFFLKDPPRFLVSFPGCLGSCCCHLTPSYTHRTTATVIDMSFGMWSQAHWRLSASPLGFFVRHIMPTVWPSSPLSMWVPEDQH